LGEGGLGWIAIFRPHQTGKETTTVTGAKFVWELGGHDEEMVGRLGMLCDLASL